MTPPPNLQAGPFWDFINSFDPEGAAHPFFQAYADAWNPEAARGTSGPSHGPPSHGSHGPHGPNGPPRGAWGARGRGGMGRCGGRRGSWRGRNEDGAFTPAIDIFTTQTHYHIHVSLPGAQKSDVGINWDGEKSELNISGVVHRYGDEEFLKSLTETKERESELGMFERKIKLEKVDGEGITAKLEDGVLRVEVPKEEKDWEQIKKIEVE